MPKFLDDIEFIDRDGKLKKVEVLPTVSIGENISFPKHINNYFNYSNINFPEGSVTTYNAELGGFKIEISGFGSASFSNVARVTRNHTLEIGNLNVAEDTYNNTEDDDGAIIIGYKNYSNSRGGSTIGAWNKVLNSKISFAFGYNNHIINSMYSATIGVNNSVNAGQSFAIGEGLTTNSRWQTAIGDFNDPNEVDFGTENKLVDMRLMVGAGNQTKGRNALVVLANGRVIANKTETGKSLVKDNDLLTKGEVIKEIKNELLTDPVLKRNVTYTNLISGGDTNNAEETLAGKNYFKATKDGKNWSGYAIVSGINNRVNADIYYANIIGTSNNIWPINYTQDYKTLDRLLINGSANSVFGNRLLISGSYNSVANSNTTVLGNYLTVNQKEISGTLTIGQYNDCKADTLFEIGNGQSVDNRTNAFEVLKNGVVRSYGMPKINSTSYDLIRGKDLYGSIRKLKQDDIIAESGFIKSIKQTDGIISATSSNTTDKLMVTSKPMDDYDVIRLQEFKPFSSLLTKDEIYNILRFNFSDFNRVEYYNGKENVVIYEKYFSINSFDQTQFFMLSDINKIYIIDNDGNKQEISESDSVPYLQICYIGLTYPSLDYYGIETYVSEYDIIDNTSSSITPDYESGKLLGIDINIKSNIDIEYTYTIPENGGAVSVKVEIKDREQNR